MRDSLSLVNLNFIFVGSMKHYVNSILILILTLLIVTVSSNNENSTTLKLTERIKIYKFHDISKTDIVSNNIVSYNHFHELSTVSIY